MMYPVPFVAAHLTKLQVQSAQQWATPHVVRTARSLEGRYASTLMESGNPLACAGAVEMWEGRAYIWSVLSCEVLASKFLGVHRFAKLMIDNLPYRRLEAVVEADFEPGHRWAQSLGFVRETEIMPAYFPDGRAGVGYGLVKS